MSIPLLQTKLHAPPPRPRLVVRPSIADKLHEGLSQPLTVICAPAGFGKTTLISQWIAQTADAVAWLALDDDDNDPVRFFTYFLAALQAVQPTLGVAAQELFATSPPPLKSTFTLLLNDLATLTAPLALILDDFHVITTPAIHEALTFLVDHLPPFCHLVLTTRVDPPLPLARWRVRNQLTEIRTDDLRFNHEAAAAFLNEVMGLTLTGDEIDTLEARTEGWIAGLQLAALSMRGRDDIAGFIQAFSGSHRHVLSYLVEEVLNRCSAETLDFLLQTSILERLSAALCDAVTGRSDSQRLLEKFEEDNLFLIPLDDARQWYRYHHLFAEVLRQGLQQRFSAAFVANLHQRASTWHQRAALMDEAIHHALAAPAFEQAATLVEEVALTMILHSEFTRLRSWLAALPEAEIGVRPLLTLYLLYIRGHSDRDAAQLAAVEALLAADETKRTPKVQGLIAITRTRLLREAGDLAGAIAISQQALDHLPAQEPLLRARITLNLAIVHYLQGELSAAAQLLPETITTGDTARLIGPLPTIYLKVQILRAQGHLYEALRLCQDGLALITRYNWQEFPASGFLYVALGELLRERNEHSAAAEYLERGIQLGQAGGHHHILIIGQLWLAWLRQAEGNMAGSQEAIRTALHLVQQHEVSRFWPLPAASCTQARLWIAQGNLVAANRWAQSSGLNETETQFSYLDEAAYVTLARLRIAEGKLADAESLLLHLHQTVTVAGRNGSLIEILILQAITYAGQHQREKARSVLTQALRLAEPEGYIRLFVDEGEAVRVLITDFRLAISDVTLANYIDQLLTAFVRQSGDMDDELPTIQLETSPATTIVHNKPFDVAQDKSKIVNLVEPLSDRELEVLQLVAAGLSNRQIAEQLIITVGTVKTHINHIFSKLAVQSRTQAIVRGQECGLL